MIFEILRKNVSQINCVVVTITLLFLVGCGKPVSEEVLEEDRQTETEKVTTRVPDLIGLTKEEAEDLLYEADLSEGTSYEYSEDIAEGIVFKTIPEAGNIAKKGTGVTLYISKGKDLNKPEPTPEPAQTTYIIPYGIIGLPVETASQQLKEMGIKVFSSSKDTTGLSEEEISNLTTGIVVECSPKEGEEYVQLDDGSTYVILYYY